MKTAAGKHALIHSARQIMPPDAEQIAAARKALPALCASDAWWVRLYAATVLVQVPPLRTPKLVDTLRGDTNPLVRETIKSAG
jgi:hypothetical protein